MRAILTVVCLTWSAVTGYLASAAFGLESLALTLPLNAVLTFVAMFSLPEPEA